MPKRDRGDAAEYDAHRRAARRPHAVETDVSGDLFSREQAAGARDAAITDSQRKAQIKRDIERLRPHVLALAKAKSVTGITVADVRALGEQHGILTGEEAGRSLSWLGPAMKAFGLVATKEVRRSEHRVERSHGNRHTVYRHPDIVRALES